MATGVQLRSLVEYWRNPETYDLKAKFREYGDGLDSWPKFRQSVYELCPYLTADLDRENGFVVILPSQRPRGASPEHAGFTYLVRKPNIVITATDRKGLPDYNVSTFTVSVATPVHTLAARDARPNYDVGFPVDGRRLFTVSADALVALQLLRDADAYSVPNGKTPLGNSEALRTVLAELVQEGLLNRYVFPPLFMPPRALTDFVNNAAPSVDKCAYLESFMIPHPSLRTMIAHTPLFALEAANLAAEGVGFYARAYRHSECVRKAGGHARDYWIRAFTFALRPRIHFVERALLGGSILSAHPTVAAWRHKAPWLAAGTALYSAPNLRAALATRIASKGAKQIRELAAVLDGAVLDTDKELRALFETDKVGVCAAHLGGAALTAGESTLLVDVSPAAQYVRLSTGLPKTLAGAIPVPPIKLSANRNADAACVVAYAQDLARGVLPTAMDSAAAIARFWTEAKKTWYPDLGSSLDSAMRALVPKVAGRDDLATLQTVNGYAGATQPALDALLLLEAVRRLAPSFKDEPLRSQIPPQGRARGYALLLKSSQSPDTTMHGLYLDEISNGIGEQTLDIRDGPQALAALAKAWTAGDDARALPVPVRRRGSLLRPRALEEGRCWDRVLEEIERKKQRTQ